MQNQTAPRPHGVPEEFYRKFGRDVTAVLSGFDRMRFRGTLRMLFNPAKMDLYLGCCGVLLKDFGSFAERMTAKVKEAARQAAQQASRPIEYLNSPTISKEELARQIAQRDHLRSNLVALFMALEPCLSYAIRKDRARQQLKLVLESRKCTHLYHYYLHPEFGLMHVRVQSWFPFTVDICLNARHWLARQMDRAGLGYEQRDNCFIFLADPVAAQALLDEQLRTPWAKVLDGLLEQAHPCHHQIRAPLGLSYYWSASESEYATDVLFRSPAALARLYPLFVRHGLSTFQSPDVLRFLGKSRPELFNGELKGRLQHRPEGVRLKHVVNGNSLKIYDKEGQILRVEATINQPRDFRVFRPTRDDPSQGMKWQELRWGVADLFRRAEVCQAANRRYLEALSSVSGTTPLAQEAATLCRAVVLKGRRYRALNPWTAHDAQLLQAVSRGEFTLGGLRNADLRKLLYPPTKDLILQRRQAAAVSRKLSLLRAHGILRKINNTHRYHLTKSGRRVVTALLVARNADVDTLNQMAA